MRFQQAPCPSNWWRWVVSTTLFKITSKRERPIFFTNFITSKIQSGNFENQKEKPHPVILCHVLNWKHTLTVYETVFSKHLLPLGQIPWESILLIKMHFYVMSKPFLLPLATWFFLYNPNLNWHSYPIKFNCAFGSVNIICNNICISSNFSRLVLSLAGKYIPMQQHLCKDCLCFL